MCGHHGTIVDRDHRRYSVSQLRKWKDGAEARAQKEHEGTFRRKPPRGATYIVNVNNPPQDVYAPRIVFRRPDGSPLHDTATGTYLYYVSQLWFVNEPEKRGTVARSLTATLDFCDMDGRSLFGVINGEWAITNARDNVGFDDTCETLSELPPVGKIAKLLVLHKRRDDGTAYAWSRGAREYPGQRHMSHQIPPGMYQLGVRIRGLYVDETFYFRLRNPGIDADPQILGLNSPDLDRE